MLSRFLTLREQLILVFFGASLLLGALVLLFHDGRDPARDSVDPAAPPAPSPATKTPRPAPPPSAPAKNTGAPDAPKKTEQNIAVGVTGAVRRPGLYHLPKGARVGHLLKAAGGALPHADLETVDLTARLRDGVTFTVPGNRARARER